MTRSMTAHALLAAALVALAGAPAARADAIVQCLILAPEHVAIWQPGSRSQVVELGLSFADLRDRDAWLRVDGWRLQDIDAAVQPSCQPGSRIVAFNAVYFHAPAIAEQAFFAQEDLEFASRNLEMQANGWRLAVVDSYQVDHQVFFNAAWRRGLHEQEDRFGWSFDDFIPEAGRRLEQGWRLRAFDAGFGPSYHSSWVRDPINTFSILAWAREHFDPIYDDARAQGWNVAGMARTGVGHEERWHVFWEHTGITEMRTTTSGRDSFGQLHQDMLAGGWNLVHLAPSY